MAVILSLSITEAANSANIANNTTNVTVIASVKWTGGSYNATGQCTGSITIDGNKYSFSGMTFNTSRTTSGSQRVMIKTVPVKHDDDGGKTLQCSASFVTGVSSGTIAASGSKELIVIPRKSTLTVANGTLGTAQTLSISEKASTFKHKLKYECGGVSGWILGDSDNFSTSNSVSWTPPLSLANQNTTGASVAVEFTLYTYANDGTSVGNDVYTKTFAIPGSVVPSVSFSVTDAAGHYDTYGAYIEGLSRFEIAVTAAGNLGSTIKSYKIVAGGKTYTKQSVTTDPAVYGANEITVTVTDSRGRTNTAKKTVAIMEYSPPQITALSAYRSNADGVADNSGAYFAVKFSSKIQPLSNKNTARYTAFCKKTSDETYENIIELADFDGKYALVDNVFVVPADPGSSYSIRLSVQDAFTYSARSTTGTSKKMFWSALKKAGKIAGFAFNKIAEHEGVFDIGWQTLFSGGIRYPVLEPDTDLDDVRTPNTYTGANISTHNYAHCPVTSGTFTLLVESCGEDGQVKQTYTSCSKYKPERFTRFYYQGSWGDWFWANTDEYILYNDENGSTGAITLAASLSHFRYIEIYFADNNYATTKKTGGYTKVYSPNGKNIMLSISEASSTIYYRQTAYAASGTTLTPDTENASFIKITAAGAVSVTENGANYIKILRVIGRA